MILVALIYFLSVFILTILMFSNKETVLEDLRKGERLRHILVTTPVIFVSIILAPYIVIALIPIQVINLLNKYLDLSIRGFYVDKSS